jgi:hypothetical protein
VTGRLSKGLRAALSCRLPSLFLQGAVTIRVVCLQRDPANSAYRSGCHKVLVSITYRTPDPVVTPA